MDVPKTADFAHIGKSVVIKGELSGSEDLYIDGTVEGTIQLESNRVVIGPNGLVRASIHAKGVVVEGKVEGNIRASDRTDFRKSAVAVGDVVTQRIAIEDGAYFKGKVEIQREGKPASSVEPKENTAAQGSAASSASTPLAQNTAVTKH